MRGSYQEVFKKYISANGILFSKENICRQERKIFPLNRVAQIHSEVQNGRISVKGDILEIAKICQLVARFSGLLKLQLIGVILFPPYSLTSLLIVIKKKDVLNQIIN